VASTLRRLQVTTRRITLRIKWLDRDLDDDELAIVRKAFEEDIDSNQVIVEMDPPKRVRVGATVSRDRDEQCLAAVLQALPGAFFRVGPPVFPAEVITLAMETL